MVNNNGNKVPNQFVITDAKGFTTFQSYETTIAKWTDNGLVLDTNAFDYSRTTSKYLYIFTNSDKKTLQLAIKNGRVSVQNLN